MKKLTQAEKKQLQAMLDKQRVEQMEKRRVLQQYQAKLRRARSPRGNVVAKSALERRKEILEQQERKLQELRQQTRKRSKLKQIQLTEREKEKLKAKIWGN